MPRREYYTTEQLAPSVWAIDTKDDESIYLIKGSERSLLIDTGSAPAPLDSLARKLCGSDPELALTHAHYDHMYHAGEFEKVYLHEKDIAAWGRLMPAVSLGILGSGRKLVHFPVRKYTALKDGDVIDLGDRQIRVIGAAGHTPGSVIFADDKDRLLFTGDAFGSGSYAWMWMPGCLCLSEYIESLAGMIKELWPYRDYTMLGGHRRQGMVPNRDPHAHELTLDTAKDMLVLCEKILAHEIEPEKTERIFGMKTETYFFGLGGIVLSEGKIK